MRHAALSANHDDQEKLMNMHRMLPWDGQPVQQGQQQDRLVSLLRLKRATPHC